MKYGTWEVRSLYRADWLMRVATELLKHKLGLVAVEQIGCDRGGTQPADEYKFSYG
jgi:hypothetical protein